MAATAPEENQELRRDVFLDQLISCSRLLGVLPFRRTNQVYRSYPFLAYSVSLILSYDLLLYFHWYQFDISRYLKSDKFLAIFSYYVTWLTTLAVPWVSLCWLNLRLHSLDNMFRGLELVRNSTRYHAGTPRLEPLLVTAVMTVLMTLKAVVDSDWTLPNYTVGLSIFPQFQVMSILFQFTSAVKVIRKYYSYLVETLSVDNAQFYVRQTDTLWRCSNLAMDCWAPQLFLLVVASFSIIVSSIYMTVVVWETGDELVFILSTLMFCLLSFYIVSTCSDTRTEV